jgi:hypothetical protein
MWSFERWKLSWCINLLLFKIDHFIIMRREQYRQVKKISFSFCLIYRHHEYVEGSFISLWSHRHIHTCSSFTRHEQNFGLTITLGPLRMRETRIKELNFVDFHWWCWVLTYKLGEALTEIAYKSQNDIIQLTVNWLLYNESCALLSSMWNHELFFLALIFFLWCGFYN